MKAGPCGYNIRNGYRHTSSCYPLLPYKPSTQAHTCRYSNLTNPQHQSQVRLVYAIPVHASAHAPILLLLTRLLTRILLIVVNWPMLYVMIAEGYLIDDGYIET